MPSDWANLPHCLLDSVVERFSSSSDYLGFALVCTSWFVVAKHNHARFAKKLLSHPEPPMLLFYNDKEDAWNFYNVVDNKVLDVQSKMPKRRFCGSSRGWLVHLEEKFTITLTKPVFYKSNKRGKREDVVVRLPKLNPPNAEVVRYVIKATITGDPILDDDAYIVVLTYENVAFIKPSKDTTWTYLSDPVGVIRDVVQYGEDHFYAIEELGNIFSVNISSKSNFEAKSLACELEQSSISPIKYLVDEGKHLLMVNRDSLVECEEDVFDIRVTYGFSVYEFCFEKCKWIEKQSLGEDVSLFIGDNSAISVVASNFPGCKQNCIYFNDEEYVICIETAHDFGVFDMEKKTRSKPYSEQLMTLLSLAYQRPIWFTPNIYL